MEPICSEEEEDGLIYGTNITYYCPEGFVFETFDLVHSNISTDRLTLTCEKYAAWSPVEQPKCIRNDSNS